MQRQLGGDEQQNKDDDSPVTVADYGAQAVVAWSLQRAFPAAFCMVAEEDSTALMCAASQPSLALALFTLACLGWVVRIQRSRRV